MKAFRNWYNKIYRGWSDPRTMELAWKAALEWVLAQEYDYDEPEVYDTIIKELEK